MLMPGAMILGQNMTIRESFKVPAILWVRQFNLKWTYKVKVTYLSVTQESLGALPAMSANLNWPLAQ